jgi:hypothetical protein
VVWCPKYRRKVLVDGVDVRLKEIIREVAAERRAEVIELEVMPDHVHLLIEVDPQFGVHRLVRLMKGRSSRLLRQEFPRLRSRLPTLWTHAPGDARPRPARLPAVSPPVPRMTPSGSRQDSRRRRANVAWVVNG